ncbi:hypothetical protein B0H19DRAFT_672668 [Mycena capillaripes]|nr:hypothetical protein B0H19DRAFT_672668 [Mycena capillaripes]
MDSDVEMVDPVPPLPHVAPPSPAAHVSPPRSRSHSVLDDLDNYASPTKSDLAADDDPSPDEHTAAGPDDRDPPPTTNDDDPDASKDGPDDEHDVDSSESENSSDDASEDDVDKDLIPDGDATDADQDEGPGRRLTAARWDDPDPTAIVIDDANNTGAIRIPVLVDSTPRSPDPDAAVTPTSPLSAPPTSAAKPVPSKKSKSHHAPPPRRHRLRPRPYRRFAWRSDWEGRTTTKLTSRARRVRRDSCGASL